jgi:hypothetical protein
MFALMLYWSWTAGAAAVSHFPATACIIDRAPDAAIADVSGTASLADEGLACP